MVKKIRWSKRAQREKHEILQFWKTKNQSDTYSIHLNQLFLDSVELLAKSPEIGLISSEYDVRIKIVRDYLIYYRIKNNFIDILAIWDSRRNPKKFKL